MNSFIKSEVSNDLLEFTIHKKNLEIEELNKKIKEMKDLLYLVTGDLFNENFEESIITSDKKNVELTKIEEPNILKTNQKRIKNSFDLCGND